MGAASTLFNTFANAVLARTLPSVREWLRAKVGEAATLEGLELDGANVHLVDARLPIGPTAVLEVDRATFTTHAGELVGGRPPLRMESMAGRLTVPGDDGPRFVAPLTFEGREPETGLEWVHGEVTVTGSRWLASMGADEQAPIDGTIHVSVTSKAWRLWDGTATAADARIEIDAAGRLDDDARAVESARLDVHDARLGHYLDALFALGGREMKLSIPLPWTSKIDGQLRLDPEGAMVADVELRTKVSSLTVKARGSRGDDSLEQASIEGVVSWTDLLPSAWSGIVDLDESAPLTLEAEAHGPFDAIEGHATLVSPRVRSALLVNDAAIDVALRAAPGLSGRVKLSVAERGAWTAEVAVDDERALSGQLGGAIAAEALDLFGVTFEGDAFALSGDLEGTLREPAIDAQLRADRLRVKRDGLTADLDAIDATATNDGLIAAFRVGAGVGRLTALRGGRPRVAVQHLDAPSAVELMQLAGASGVVRLASEDPESATFALPDDATIDLDLGLEEDRVEGTVELATPRSRLHLTPLVVRTADGALDGSQITGTLAAVDALDAGLFPGPIHVDRTGSAQLDGRLVGAGAHSALEGRLLTASLGWCFRARPDLPPIVLSAAAANLRVDGEAVSLGDLEGNLFGGRARMDLRITYIGETPTGRVTIEGAKEGLGKWLGAAMYTARALPSLRGELALESDDDGAMVGPVRLATPTSTLSMGVYIARDGAVDGTRAQGELSLSDVYELLPRGGPTLVGKGKLGIDAALEGPFTEPSAQLKVHGEALTLLVAGESFKGLRVGIDRLLARTHVSLDRVVWRELVVHAFDGKLSSQGLVGFGEGFRGMQAKISVDDVSLARVPTPGGGTLEPHLGGRLNGQLTLKRKGSDLSGKGELWVDEPRYPVLKLTAESLAKVGLKPPSPRGTEPFMAQVRGGSAGWMIKGLSGAVHGARCEGDLAVRPDGTLLGKLDLVAEAIYLRSSTLLNLPAAALGDVKIPMKVLGTLASPEYEADVLGAFDHLVGKTRIGRGLHRVVDRAVDRVMGGARRLDLEESEAPGDLDTDVIIRRIARGVGDEDAYLDALIDRGLSPDEIATRIERAREGT